MSPWRRKDSGLLTSSWQGVEDPVFGRPVAEEHIKLFTNAPEATLDFVEGGGHYLNATSPKEVDAAILKMVQKYAP